MKPETSFLSLAEELRIYILSFLSCRDILRCTSVCKALCQTYMSSSELQYIVEMSGQRLLHVSDTDNGIPVSVRLQLLRDKAHAWFKFDVHSFETVFVERPLQLRQQVVAGGHVYFYNTYTAMIFPILPKFSQQQFQRNWPPGTLCSVPNSNILDLIMDPAQNLIAAAFIVDNRRVCIKLGALDSDGVHPQAAGETLILSDGPENLPETLHPKLKCFGRHIALWRRLTNSTWGSMDDEWQLQVWDWKHSMTSSSILRFSYTVVSESKTNADFLFLGNDRLLVITDNLHLYLIEDMSQAPELLAHFLMPFPLRLQCHLPMGDIEHSQTHMQAQPTMYTSDPAHRLICLTAYSPDASFYYGTQVFIISTRIFFDLDGMTVATSIRWEHWGPSNVRIFTHPHGSRVHISGNRVLQALRVPVGSGDSEFILHLMDFSPLAMTNSRGLGQVVNEPSTIEVFTRKTGRRSRRSLTTSMPYVQVVSSNRNLKSSDSNLDKHMDRQG
ncbi:hypothetical protein EDD22DRAFT_47872 [Suillus occidentalis]|nr:hypothetical protein EDD22DRAFT_47872 [Suillus occidentalis]